MKNRTQEARRWLRQAQSDLGFLETARNAGKHDACCFLAQQTAEKALKAFLFFQGEELVFSHSIFRLTAMAAEYDAKFQQIQESVKQLDFYYVEARYPNALEEVIPAEFFNAADAAQAIAMASRVVEAVEARLATPLSGTEPEE